MRKLFVAAAAAVVLTAGSVGAQSPIFTGPLLRTATIDRHSGMVVPTTTRLQPVIGSVRPAPRRFHLFGHKARYSATMFNPVQGTFSTQIFKWKR